MRRSSSSTPPPQRFTELQEIVRRTADAERPLPSITTSLIDPTPPMAWMEKVKKMEEPKREEEQVKQLSNIQTKPTQEEPVSNNQCKEEKIDPPPGIPEGTLVKPESDPPESKSTSPLATKKSSLITGLQTRTLPVFKTEPEPNAPPAYTSDPETSQRLTLTKTKTSRNTSEKPMKTTFRPFLPPIFPSLPRFFPRQQKSFNRPPPPLHKKPFNLTPNQPPPLFSKNTFPPFPTKLSPPLRP